MGVEKGLALIERLEGVEGFLVVEAPDGSLRDHPLAAHAAGAGP